MKEKCKNCAHPSKACVSYLMTLTTKETLEWCKMWKERFGWSNATVAEKSNVPVGTINRIFSQSKTEDVAAGVKLSTIRPVICALTGCTLEDLESCEDHADLPAITQAKMEHQADTIRLLEGANARLLASAAEAEHKHAEETAFLKDVANSRMKTIRTLSVLLAVAVLAIITALVIDILNPDMGFFWLDELKATIGGMSHSGIVDGIKNALL